MSNKPILPNAYVDINNQNLGLVEEAPAGVKAFLGCCQEGSEAFDAITSVGNKGEVQSKIGFGELADFLIDSFNNGGKKAYVVPLDIDASALADVGTPAYVRAGSSTGTIAAAAEAAKKITNQFNIKIEVLKTGGTGVGKWKISTDDGTNYGPGLTMGATYTIPGTNLEITLTGAFDDGDVITVVIGATTKPDTTTAKIEAAVDALITSNYDYDSIVVCNDADAALMGSIKTKVQNAEAKPDFRYCYALVHPVLSSSASNAVSAATTIMAAIANDRVQVVTGESVQARPNHGDQWDRNNIGVVAGRRSALALQNDLGKFNAGTLNNIIEARTGWTDTTIEDLDALRTVTIRQYKGTAGFRPTNGKMSDAFSDVKKDAWRLVLDKASNIARIAALNFLKMDVDPADVAGSTTHLKNTIQNAIDTLMTGNDEIVQATVTIPAGQNILQTEELKVEIEIIPFGHASWIGITIALVNPLTQAA